MIYVKKKDQEKFIAGHTAKNVYIISQPLPDRQGFMWKIKRSRSGRSNWGWESMLV